MSFYLRHSLGFFLQIFPCIILCYIPFKERKYRLSKKAVLISSLGINLTFSLIFPLILNDTIINILGSIDGCANSYMLLAAAVIIIYFWTTVNESAMKKIIVINLVVFYAAAQFMIVNLAVPLMNLSGRSETFSMTYLVLYILTTIIQFPIAVLLMKKTVYKYMQEMDTENVRNEFRWIINLSIINVVLMLFYAMVPYKAFEYFWITLAPSFLLIIVVIARLYYSLFQESIVRKHNEEKRRMLEISKIQYQNIIDEIEITKRQKHDMRHHLRVIYNMAEKNEYEQLKKYVSDLIEVSDKSNYENFCENRTINGLLQYFIGIARSEEIECVINVICGDVNIYDSDLTVILGNALENAIKSCKEADISKKIFIDIGIVGSALMIQIKNTCIAVHPSGKYKISEDFVPAEAFLSNRRNGGFGIVSIENTAEKYGGEAVFKYDDKSKLFVTRVRLNFYPEIL